LQDEEYEFLWEDRITANDFCLLQGDGGVGKGLFAVWLMSELTKGTLPGIFLGHPTRCLFISTEEVYNKATKPRLKAQGYNGDLILYLNQNKIIGGDSLTLEPWKTKALMQDWNRRGIRVVILDPVQDFFPDAANPDNRKDVRNILRHLQSYGQQYGVTVIGIHHENKGSYGSASDKGAGSKAFRDVARSGFRLAFGRNTDDEEERYANPIKSNYSSGKSSFKYEIVEAKVTTDDGQEISTGKFVMGESIESTANDVIQAEGLSQKERSFVRKETTKAEIALLEKLIECSTEGMEPAHHRTIAKAVGVSSATVRLNAFKSLIEHGLAENTGQRGKPGVWRITDMAKAKRYLQEIKPRPGINDSFRDLAV
jgi:hypothetical protein